jgi:CBS domain containing-hemolysin-like protein
MDDPLSSNGQPVFPASDPKNNQQDTQPFIDSVRDWLRHALGGRSDGSLKEALEEIIEEHQGQADEGLEPEEKVMLHNVLSFGDLRVRDIMVPRTDIAAVPSDITMSELKIHIMEQRHTRIPVYNETLDQLQGFIHVKDMIPMLSGEVPFDLKRVMRNLLFVPPSMRILDLLVKMRHAGSHMAIVVDEYGGTDGLVTMEDLFEEIVGDIQDEHDEDEQQENKIHRIAEGVYEVNGRMLIDTLEKELGLSLVTEEGQEEFDTLAGLIFFQLGRVPSKGEKIQHISGCTFEILDVDPRRIRKVRIMTASQPAS